MKGCDKVVDFEGKPFKLKLYSPLRNATKGVHFAKGENILKYKVKANALSKSSPLEICNKVPKEFVVVRKKQVTRHGGKPIKQVPKIDKIQEHPTSQKFTP
jgi:hypothetical protein